MSVESVMPSNRLILCHPLLLPPSIFPSIRVFSNEPALCLQSIGEKKKKKEWKKKAQRRAVCFLTLRTVQVCLLLQDPQPTGVGSSHSDMWSLTHMVLPAKLLAHVSVFTLETPATVDERGAASHAAAHVCALDALQGVDPVTPHAYEEAPIPRTSGWDSVWRWGSL